MMYIKKKMVTLSFFELREREREYSTQTLTCSEEEESPLSPLSSLVYYKVTLTLTLIHTHVIYANDQLSNSF